MLLLGANASKTGPTEKMAQQVKVEVQPGEALRFPNVCVNCGEGSTGWLPLRKRRGAVTREIKVPLCTDCQQHLGRLSGEEERWRKMGWLFGGLALVVGSVLFYFLWPGWLPLLLRILLALLAAGASGAAVLFAFRRASLQHARPEKLAVLKAASLGDFTWRTTTLEFEREAFAEAFKALNEERIFNETERDERNAREELT